MTLRQSFRPLRPELDNFLFATVGDEIDGMPLSVISALTRVGLDPWEEAGRLSRLGSREAVEQLSRLIAELPGILRPLGESREIAGSLVKLLPKYDTDRASGPQVQIRTRYLKLSLPMPSPLWTVLFMLAAALLVSAIVHGRFPFGIGGP